MQENNQLIQSINAELQLQLAEDFSINELKARLTIEINQLINTNFEKLVFYLYRIDVNENKMRQLLSNQQEADAAGLIAELIIERQLQKIKSRQDNSRDKNISEEEKW